MCIRDSLTTLVAQSGGAVQGDTVDLAPAIESLICPTLNDLPILPVENQPMPQYVLGFDGAGDCVKIEQPCHIVADAGNELWDSTNAAWIDPASLPDGCSMLLKNSLESGPAGSSSWWRVLESGSGHQWHWII